MTEDQKTLVRTLRRAGVNPLSIAFDNNLPYAEVYCLAEDDDKRRKERVKTERAAHDAAKSAAKAAEASADVAALASVKANEKAEYERLRGLGSSSLDEAATWRCR